MSIGKVCVSILISFFVSSASFAANSISDVNCKVNLTIEPSDGTGWNVQAIKNELAEKGYSISPVDCQECLQMNFLGKHDEFWGKRVTHYSISLYRNLNPGWEKIFNQWN